MRNIRFLLSSNPTNLAATLENNASATVEAEYGNTLVEGSVVTLAHHGSRSANPAPCLADNMSAEIEVVGLSHVDLDSLGGCLAILGQKPEAPAFWNLAAFVDVRGPHKLGESGASAKDIRRLNAFWAWSEANRLFPPRDDSVADATAWIEKAEAVIGRILADDEEILTAGDEFRRKGDELNTVSFVEESEGVVLRESEAFVNHLYVLPDGKVVKAVVSYNPKNRAVTLSLADPIPGVSCRDIAVELWGDQAGGHAGIAGGPRTGLDREEADRAAVALRAALAGK